MSQKESPSTLSKNIMKMKFMQRGEEAALRDQLRQERESSMREAQWIADSSAMKSIVLMEDVSTVDVKSARRTFGNFSSAPKPVAPSPSKADETELPRGKPSGGRPLVKGFDPEKKRKRNPRFGDKTSKKTKYDEDE